MTNPARMEQLLAVFYNGQEQEINVPYIGKYRVNNSMVHGVPTPDIEAAWSESVVPIEYLPLYGLKFGEPELAGGLFESAPFQQYDRDAPEYEWMNLPEAPESIYQLCTDHCGAQFWIGDSLTVYGHNLDNEIQPIGTLASFVDYAIDQALESRSWYERIKDVKATTKYGLQAINSMD